MKNGQKRQKNGQNLSLRARFQATHTTCSKTFDVCGKRLITSCYRKKFHGKILKTHRVMPKKPLKMHIFNLPPVENGSRDKPLM